MRRRLVRLVRFVAWCGGGMLAAAVLHSGLGMGCIQTGALTYGLGWIIGWARLDDLDDKK